MAATLSADVLRRYRRFSLYNSPFVAHDAGRAIDLYPPGCREPGAGDGDGDGRAESVHVPSPVAGEVREVKRVRGPSRPYAADHDYLLLVDVGDYVARVMHVDPDVAAGDRIAVGDDLGDPIRAGFFAPWVPNHVHLELRDPAADRYRAAGSVPIAVDVDVRPVDWDGTGTVVETGETWALLDAPAHPAPGESFAGVANDGGPGVLDGGLPHYDGGGLLGGDGTQRVALAGTTVGVADGRDVTWRDLTVAADGEPVTGLALYCSRDRTGVKLVGESVDLTVGDDVAVRLR